MVAMSSSATQGIVGKKFSFGVGPKPVVEKINKYFNATNSISLALNKLLDRFEKSAFVYYEPPQQGDLVELSKNILYGKPGDDLMSIKNAFTRLSVTLKENETYKRFGNEAPILLLDHMLTPRAPQIMTRSNLMVMLGMKKVRSVRPPTSTEERFKQKDAHFLTLEMSQRLGLDVQKSATTAPPTTQATMQPGQSTLYRGLIAKTALQTSRKRKNQPNSAENAKRKKTNPNPHRGGDPTSKLTNAQMDYMNNARVLLERIQI